MPSYGPGYAAMKARARQASVPAAAAPEQAAPVLAVLARVEQRLDRLDQGDAALAEARAEADRLRRAIADRDASGAAMVDTVAALRADLAATRRQRDAAADEAQAMLAQVTLERDAAVQAVAMLDGVTQERDAAVQAVETLKGAAQERDAALRAAAMLDGVAQERDAALRTAAMLEGVAQERDAADRLCRSLQDQLAAAGQNAARLEARLAETRRAHSETAARLTRIETESHRVTAERDRLMIEQAPPKNEPCPVPAPAPAGPCRACAAAAQEIAALKVKINAEQTRKNELLRQRDGARVQVRDTEARLRAAATAPTERAEPGPFLLERDAGRHLVWWTGELVGGAPVRTRTLQLARPLLTRAEAAAWLTSSRAFAGWRYVTFPEGRAREASS